MATQTYAITDSNIRSGGLHGYGQLSAGLQGQAIFIGLTSCYESKFTGTDLTAKLTRVNTTPVYSVSVDGAAFAPLTLGGAGTPTDVVLFAGLSDTQHSVILRHTSGTQTDVGIDVAAAFTLTGAAPAIAPPDLYGTIYNISEFPFARYALYTGGCDVRAATNGYSSPLALGFPDCSVIFRGNPTSIRVWGQFNQAKYRVHQDGVAVAAAGTLPSTSIWGWQTIATGLDGAMHEYEIIAVNQVDFIMHQIMLVGGDIEGISAPANKYGLLTIGDSWVEGVGTTDSTLNWPRLIAVGTNRRSFNQGLSSGRCVYANGVSVISTEQRTADYLNWNQLQPGLIDRIIFEIGNNDHINDVLAADFTRAYTRQLTLVRNAFPDAKIFCMGPVPATEAQFAAAKRALMATNVQTAVTDFADADVTYVSWDALTSAPYNYNTTAGQDTLDGLHPNSAGAAKISTYGQTFIDDAPDYSPASGAIPSFGGLLAVR